MPLTARLNATFAFLSVHMYVRSKYFVIFFLKLFLSIDF